ncbi:MAG: tyrosine-type recombinase/integrase [Sterolibacteriaceae bacterium]|uniref:Tyrosine-type recombinase/integrase n=1 Tax=Candidatus Methylophosphatis roskildensis TaxID=2899263 RepID=A0A9D7HPA5_9PROT|nr:tyrosine-type recombinase/integrase [Candidatus Methylophosphatis roskildensis]MBK6975653.1 tyrosine-type recombinase/integrase [Candidatus Methylophosphatis roskildensis]MBK7238332.1 tyrosine-type recombinase/integrase [Sterolibacteriaceae bacterium]
MSPYLRGRQLTEIDRELIAKIAEVKWHGLRHTWASWVAQAGTPLNVLQELGGWESESMVRRYAHLAPAQLIEHSEKVAGLLGGTNTAHRGKKGQADA